MLLCMLAARVGNMQIKQESLLDFFFENPDKRDVGRRREKKEKEIEEIVDGERKKEFVG